MLELNGSDTPGPGGRTEPLQRENQLKVARASDHLRVLRNSSAVRFRWHEALCIRLPCSAKSEHCFPTEPFSNQAHLGSPSFVRCCDKIRSSLP